MLLQGELPAACVDEEAALDFVQGRLSESDVRAIDQHVDRCDRCRLMLSEAARSLRSRMTGAPSSPATPLTRFVPGEKLADRYRILRFIARGGMGEVYEAYDLILNTRLALKTLAATISDDPHAIRRLKQEVNLARLITHPNVCRIFDLGVHEQAGTSAPHGVLFITMELVPGISLGERLREAGRMDSAAVLPITRAIVAAIDAAHRADIVHRDLKSDNVMLATDERGQQRVVVMDFGLARAASLAPDVHSADGPTLAGTLAYMAPEQLEAKGVTAATDIYALGVVMYEMLTGKLPFRGEPAVAAAWKRVTHPAPTLAEVAPDVDPRWHPIVAACLERDPARRPRSAAHVARALEALGPSDNPTDDLQPSPAPAPPRRGRRTSAAMATLAVLLVVVSVPLVRFWLQRTARGAPAGPAPTATARAAAGTAAGTPDRSRASATGAATPAGPAVPPVPPPHPEVHPEATLAAAAPTPSVSNATRVHRPAPMRTVSHQTAPAALPASTTTAPEPAVTGTRPPGEGEPPPSPKPPGERRSADPNDGFI